MTFPGPSLPRTDAGTFPSGLIAAGAFSTSHGKGEGSLTAARAVLAQVSDCDDRQIARACRVVLDSHLAEPQERKDVHALLHYLPPLALKIVARETEGAGHA